MRIGKPLLVTTTVIGLATGIYEGYHLAGPIMSVGVGVMALFGVAIAWTALRSRREQRELQANRAPGKSTDHR